MPNSIALVVMAGFFCLLGYVIVAISPPAAMIIAVSLVVVLLAAICLGDVHNHVKRSKKVEVNATNPEPSKD